ncbi:MAG: hypothetical protein IBJ03_04535 [Gemmatimonadaceae bacterium]|nr:hypothetical protein [Gemmatimonadaceae bacterium]
MATGLPKEIGLPAPIGTADFIYHPLVNGAATGERAKRSSPADIEATRLVEYLDKCLGLYDFELKPEGQAAFAELVGELLNNCEDHSGGSDWWIAAYLRQPKGGNVGDVHLAIFSFGDTIAESMRSLPSESMLRKDIDRLLTHHRKIGTFRKLAEETFWTLLAIQQRVSRKNKLPNRVGNRGQGTVRMMEAFRRLGSTAAGLSPVMTLVSGRSQLIFDGEYELSAKGQQKAGQRTIAFNIPNSLELPPDPAKVRTLATSFPGTLISLRFYLDPTNLQQASEYAVKSSQPRRAQG